MSVSIYTPNSCQYKQLKLKDVVYLVSKSHTKFVAVDMDNNGYIVSLSEIPMALNCFNVQFTEEETLDERYKFTKRLSFSMNGYVPLDYLQEKYYAIIMTEDNTPYMINVDFPSKVTYTFTLDGNSYQTDFTFSSQSNFPTLMIINRRNNFKEPEKDCGYKISGIEDLYLVEKQYATISKAGDTATVTLFGKSWSDVGFLKDSCSIQEVFDGERITDTITFDIGFDNYKTSWHYNLLEFLENLYAARITSKGDNKNYFFGFNLGLQPSYNINASSSDNGSGKITVTLTESSSYGLVQAQNYVEHSSTDKQWVYVERIGNVKGYECVSLGVARYLLQWEVDGLGNPTGRYKCLEGYVEYFQQQGLTIYGTFTETEEFPSQDCGETDLCDLYTTIPNPRVFNAATCANYTISASCDWHVSNLPSYITIQPSQGVANQSYTVRMCNTLAPSSTEVEGSYNIHYGDNVKIMGVKISSQGGFINPENAYINCLPQSTTFTYNPNCAIRVVSIPQGLTYTMGSGTLIVSVPKNESVLVGRTYPIIVEDCNGTRATVTIHQDKTYEKWVETSGYLCDNGNSYKKLERYTGSTATNINTRTGEVKLGDLIQEGDTRCSSYITRWSFLNHYYCVNGNKYKALEEEISYDNGQTWTKTGATKLGELVESQSEWCNLPVTYEWRLTTKWECNSN